MVLSGSCLCIPAEELGGDSRGEAVIKERGYLCTSDTRGYLQCPFGMGQEAGCGSTWWRLGQQLSCDSSVCCQFMLWEGKGSRSAGEEHPGHILRTGPDSRVGISSLLLFAPVMKSVDSEVWLIFHVRQHVDADSKEVNVCSYVLCFSQIPVMTDFSITFRITLGKDVLSPGCSPRCRMCSGNAKW